MAKWRKKPVVVEAEVYKEGMEDGYQVRWTENVQGITSRTPFFMPKSQFQLVIKGLVTKIAPAIKTLEGWHIISPGDFIVTGVKGERYPCKPDIFHATYEPVDEDIHISAILQSEESRRPNVIVNVEPRIGI